MKVSYSEPSEIKGWSDLKEAKQEKVHCAWKEDTISDENESIKEAVDTSKKVPAERKNKKDRNNVKKTDKLKQSHAKKAKADKEDEEEAKEEKDE
ncbi:hypothetical protein SCP_0401160 [Sparassis crispa]|uniref:Uncharacterized protein n=1 Tax=Sparassis crispa TaxID=139825 RepID=A0A401GHR7_9APHY|nr:hypothetical protein SCP_0401160 [Sparassis crispa]GBE81744.1 hypothetical protein SCP_0401160 [Sparassis crispa]